MNNAWLLIDGYNIVKPSAPPRRGGDNRWLHRERMLLLSRLAEHLPAVVRDKTLVVFDAKDPPPGVADALEHETIRVRFAVEHDEADDLIEELIAEHSAPKRLMVVSSDNRLRTAASRRGASVANSDEWIDALVDGVVRLAVEVPGEDGDGSHSGGGGVRRGGGSEGAGDSGLGDVDWMSEFGLD